MGAPGMVKALLAALLVVQLASFVAGGAAVPAVPRRDAQNPFLSGSIMQSAVLAASYPVDVLKTRLQIPFGAPGPYQATKKAFDVRWLNARQPPFWPGAPAAYLNLLPSLAIFDVAFQGCRGFLDDKFPRANKLAVDVASTGVAAVVASAWSTPCEVVKCTFQSGMYTSSLKSAVRAIHKESGWRGFYQGYAAQLARDVPVYLLVLGGYEALRDKYITTFLTETDARGRVTRGTPSAMANAALGAVVGGVAGALTNPLDVARTQATLRTWGGSALSQESSLKLVTQVLSDQGLRGLMAGAPLRAASLALGSAAFFAAYEKAQGN